jgi:hypothetical protein
MNRAVLIIMLLLIYIGVTMACSQDVRMDELGLELSPTFTVDYVDKQGQDQKFTFRGIENKIGITDAPLIIGVSQKVIWHFWDDAEQVVGKTLKVEGTSEESGERLILLESDRLTLAPNLGATTSLPSGIQLNELGLWKLDIYLDNAYYDSLIVEGKQSY